MRHLVVLVLALLCAPLAAAAPAPDALVLAADGRLLLVDQSGQTTGAVDGVRGLCCVAWSPDGARFAFVDQTARRRLVVAAADGSGVRQVVGEDVSGALVWVSPTELAVNRSLAAGSPTSLWLVPVDGGEPRLLANASDGNYPLRMQPSGSLLLYTVSQSGALRRAVIDTRSGVSTVLPSQVGAVWSPDGGLLAAPTTDGIELLRPDGGGRRAILSGLPSQGASPVVDLAWSPDGRRIVFTRRVAFPELASRFGTPIRDEIYSIAADGSDLMRLTGVGGDGFHAGGSYGSARAEWWPGGSRLFVSRPGDAGVWTMNPDGSCETRWRGPVGVGYPVWRPGAAIDAAPVDCSSVVVRLRSSRFEVSYRGPLSLTIVIRNDGTRALRDVRLTLETTHGVMRAGACGLGVRLVCAVGDIAVGRELVLAVTTTFVSPGRARVTASAASASAEDIDPADDVASILADVSPCELLGTWGSDRLTGTARSELICGRPGPDYIDGRGGADTIEAGSGEDAVVAGPGRDYVDGGGGRDTIRVRDGERDVVDCGTERDTVVADRKDVLRRCERVRRF